MNLQTRLALEPHPEGGYFRRIYTAATTVQAAYGERHAVSSIHYLLTAEHPRGRFHKVRSTILHYLQSGGPVQYACVDEKGRLTETVLGTADDQPLFLEVPAGVWKSSRLLDSADHALVSEVVIPAFDWADHEYLDVALLPVALQQQLRGAGWVD
ncbi:MAG: cupin domain-containing protein [Stagnimonas sp.]|nr:cupin domain-containing protein [Stagnimonas sp.]